MPKKKRKMPFCTWEPLPKHVPFFGGGNQLVFEIGSFFFAAWFSFRIPKGGVPTWRPSYNLWGQGVFGWLALTAPSNSNSNNSQEKPRLAQASPTAVDSSEAVVLRRLWQNRGSDGYGKTGTKFGGSRIFTGGGLLREQSHNILANSIASCLVAMVFKDFHLQHLFITIHLGESDPFSTWHSMANRS